MQDVIAAHGDQRSWRTFQRQPAQQGRGTDRQLRRFVGTTSGRKLAYVRHLVRALDLDHFPPPLGTVLADVTR